MKSIVTTVVVLLSALLMACDKTPLRTPTAPAASLPSSDTSGSVPLKPSVSDAIETGNQKEAEAASLPSADPKTPLSDYVRLENGDQLMYVFAAVSKLPPDFEKMTQAISSEYRHTSDSFKRQDIVKALTPRIKDEIEKAANVRYVVWQSASYPIKPYDFEKKAFPIKSDNWDGRSNFYFSANSSTKISFSAGPTLQSFPVADEVRARQIEGMVAKFNQFSLRTYGFIKDVDLNSQTIKTEVLKYELLDQQGNVLASTGL